MRQHIPADARILGLQTYWFGLDDFTYRSWFVPIAGSRDVTANPPPTIPEALTTVDPTVILIDDAVQGMLLAEPVITDWMTAQGFELQGVVEDETYGRMEIWLRSRP